MNAETSTRLMPNEISIEGPVELIDGKLTIQIPLAVGGDKLAPYARGIGESDEENLTVIVPPWLPKSFALGSAAWSWSII